MKYSIDINYYTANGYSHTETYEAGTCGQIITAQDWANGCRDNDPEFFSDVLTGDTEYIVLTAQVWEDGADQSTADPIATSDYTIDLDD